MGERSTNMTITVTFNSGRTIEVPTTPATYAADKADWEQNPNVDHVE